MFKFTFSRQCLCSVFAQHLIDASSRRASTASAALISSLPAFVPLVAPALPTVTNAVCSLHHMMTHSRPDESRTIALQVQQTKKYEQRRRSTNHRVLKSDTHTTTKNNSSSAVSSLHTSNSTDGEKQSYDEETDDDDDVKTQRMASTKPSRPRPGHRRVLPILSRTQSPALSDDTLGEFTLSESAQSQLQSQFFMQQQQSRLMLAVLAAAGIAPATARSVAAHSAKLLAGPARLAAAPATTVLFEGFLSYRKAGRFASWRTGYAVVTAYGCAVYESVPPATHSACRISSNPHTNATCAKQVVASSSGSGKCGQADVADAETMHYTCVGCGNTSCATFLSKHGIKTDTTNDTAVFNAAGQDRGASFVTAPKLTMPSVRALHAQHVLAQTQQLPHQQQSALQLLQSSSTDNDERTALPCIGTVAFTERDVDHLVVLVNNSKIGRAHV